MTEENRSMGEKTRGRIAGTALTLVVLVAMAVASTAPAASAACPNEAFRTGPSALLPECRAYEMVTPVDKEGGVGFEGRQTPVRATSSGGGIYFNSVSAYADPQGNFLRNPYIAIRTGDAWRTQSIGGPQANNFGVVYFSTFAVSEDLGLAVAASREALAPGAVPDGSNLYLRDNRTGTYTTLAGLEGNAAFSSWTSEAVGYADPFVDASSDFSHILIHSNYSLTPDAPEGQNNLYELHAGQFHLVVAEAAPAAGSELNPNQMSTDGSRFFFVKNAQLYEHVTGAPTLLVSEDEEGNPISNSQFVGATPDGETAFFYVPNAGLYRFEASAPAGERVTALVPANGLEGEFTNVQKAYAGEDGTTVYFASPNLLTSDAEPPAPSGGNGYELYVWHGEPGQPGTIRFIGKSGQPSEGFPQTAGVSPDGRFFGLESRGRITPDAIDGSAAAPASGPVRYQNVFLYSLDANRIVCVTCDGSPPAGDSRLGGAEVAQATINAQRSVLDDGTIFFDTLNALSPRDANGVLDPYSWHAGSTQLISSGVGLYPSSFVDASADGSDVFFQTQQPLVGQDIDESADLYDARVGGGLPQAGAPPPPSCIPGDDCRVGPVSSSPPAQPGTAAVGDAREGTGSCSALQGRARSARRRSHALARRAKAADGKAAKALRKSAAREAKTARRLGRRAHDCTGGGR